MGQDIQHFEDFKFNKQLLNAVAEQGFTKPTLVQKKTIPLIMGGHDVLGIAQTGTGKTAAFLLPILMKVKYAQGMNPRAIIIAPTRELAIQINKHIEFLSKYTGLRHIAIYGGIGMHPQIEEIKKGIDILVATPGRFMDIYLKGELITKDIKFMVMDEADRMMDMGFFPQIRRILEVIPRKRQNLLFSATMPEHVTKLSDEFLEFPQRVEITPQATTADTIEQRAYFVPNFKTKINLLQYLTRSEELNRVIIFTKTKEIANNIFHFLDRKVEGEARVMHGNKGQNARLNAIDAFKEGEIRFLVTTDVSARGIDVSQVSHVINFDAPVIYQDYVHRVGRTGRAENLGIAITFIHEADRYHLKKIEELIDKKIPKLDMPKEVEVEKTPKEEIIEMARDIDKQKRREDPDFKGAFHIKKKKNTKENSGKMSDKRRKKR